MGNTQDQRGYFLNFIRNWHGSNLTFMEVCGTHTVSAARSGLHRLLSPKIRLISGPGCPVCVTPIDYINHGLTLSMLKNVTIATFGDLMRVPGSKNPSMSDKHPCLISAKAFGADIRVVYSPLNAIKLASELSDRQVVFLSVGFETTTPAVAAAIIQAKNAGISNISFLVANKTIIETLLVLSSSDNVKLDGFLCPGHVSVIIGTKAYQMIPKNHQISCAIAGFEPLEMLRAIVALLRQKSQGIYTVDNCYSGVVAEDGNPKARQLMYKVFEPCDSVWRGLGNIPDSGLRLRREYRIYDASYRFDVEIPSSLEPKGCHCGEVIRGVISPPQCTLFGLQCTPETPKGACMVSSEGSCAAYYNYKDMV